MSETKLILGDCIDKLKELPDESVDAVVCDPPYGLEFMGKDFDSFAPKWRDFDDVPEEWVKDYESERS